MKRVGTRPTKPGDLLLPTRVQNGLTLEGVQSFTSRRLQYFCLLRHPFRKYNIKKI
jgi:hypothetical protein